MSPLSVRRSSGLCSPPGILAAGVFVNEPVESVAGLLDRGVINVVQLHGSEDDA